MLRRGAAHPISNEQGLIAIKDAVGRSSYEKASSVIVTGKEKSDG
tara:strand:- start:191 stop:325 length:135 start_codon:yes stop_codon:yes gene_type:complete